MADLSNGTYWSEVDASNNSAPPNGWPEGMMPSGVNDSARSDKGAVKRFWDRINPVQQITPSGGSWTFSTSNPSYPSSYVDGEIFTFATAFASVGNDTFRVNALAAKPIMVQRNGVWGAIAAYDIVSSYTPMLIHLSTLNAGAGGFALVNPHVPVLADGTPYGGSMSGNLTVAGSIQSNSTAATALYAPSGGLAVGANITAPNGSLTVGTTGSFGGTVSAPAVSTGTLTATGLSTLQHVTASGNISATAGTGTFVIVNVTGGGTALNVSAGNANIAGTLTAGGLAVSSGTVTANVFSGNSLTITGTGSFAGVVTISTGGFALNLTGGGISAVGFIQTNAVGRAFYAPSGNLEIGGTGFIGGNTTIAGTLSVTGTTTHSGAVTISAGGANVLNVPNGGITTGYNVTAATGNFSGAVSVGGDYSTTSGNITTTTGTVGANIISATGSGGTAIRAFGPSGGISVAGTGLKPGGGTWADSSDIRTKDADSIADYTRGLEAVLQLRPRSFRKNGRGGTIRDGKTYIGLVADEALPVMPEMIGRIAEKLDPSDAETTDILTLEATAVIYALVNSCKEIASRLDALEGELHAIPRPDPAPRPHRR